MDGNIFDPFCSDSFLSSQMRIAKIAGKFNLRINKFIIKIPVIWVTHISHGLSGTIAIKHYKSLRHHTFVPC
jgi:hypothetical protein